MHNKGNIYWTGTLTIACSTDILILRQQITQIHVFINYFVDLFSYIKKMLYSIVDLWLDSGGFMS